MTGDDLAPMHVLHAEQVGVQRDGRWLLDNVSLALAPGQLSMLIGPNGAGKSTLLRVLAGTMAPDRGQAKLDGRSLQQWKLAELATRRAVLPQSMELAFRMTVAELIMIGCSSPSESLLSSALAATDIASMRDCIYQQLSGGEQARVQLSRALAQLGLPAAGPTPAICYLLLDEPIASLDPRHQHRLLQRIRSLVAHHRLGVLVTMHDLNLASQYADEVWLLEEGRLLRYGPASEVVSNDVIGSVFDVSLQATTLQRGDQMIRAVATTPRVSK